MNKHVVRYDGVVSTNSLALELGEQGARHGTVITAVHQSGGRGRKGRSFFSPPGGLYFSLILRPVLSPDRFPLLTLAAGIAGCTIIENAAGLDVLLKWPNDLYLENRKFGGILCESAAYSFAAGIVPFVVVGIGLNINTRLAQFPPALQETVTSLFSLQKKKYDLEPIMSAITGQILGYVDEPEQMHEVILDAWRQRDYLRGRELQWRGPESPVIRGEGAGLLSDGRYALRTAAGELVPVLGGELDILDTGG
ncbi:MAG: biotin--[acetyl-CoA-carboxylase] ligase [Desulfobulbaceae bacterium]|nr:biotin--[acetyl-CoA-carboxylase] ligase [Desulfobulbaceae bacterium]